MKIDLKPLWDNFSTQIIILLGIVALGLIIVGVVTQGIGRTIAMVLGIMCLAMLVLLLGNLKEIGGWLKDQIWKPAETPTPAAGLIFPLKEILRNGIQLYTRI